VALKIISVAGARPNLMKVTAICEAIKAINGWAAGEEIQHVLVHTGSNRSDSFFNDLELPKPDLCLEVDSGSYALQTARIMESFENVILSERPHVVLVVGDASLTLACALVTKKTWCRGDEGAEDFIPKLAHVEAGLRSFDRTMPEEINRIATDSISDYLFTTEQSANRNLVHQGVPDERVHFVGNVLIDTLLRHHSKAQESTILQELQLADGARVKPYAILSVHRSEIIDDGRGLSQMLAAFLRISKRMPVIFPAHPHILKRIQDEGLGDYFVDHFVQDPEPWDARVRIRLIPQLGYLDFVRLMSEASVVLTDSRGIQDETTMLGVPCITLRDRTERTVTVEQGTNVLAGSNPEKIISEFNRAHHTRRKSNRSPRYWDGNAARRIIKVLLDDLRPERSLAATGSGLEEERSQSSTAHRPHAGPALPRPRSRLG
jgi:UDP-N-acetylglucosamine 2-epimerase (non-hydrolysing)